MSRHRAVRNLDLEDVLDEDHLDADYDENQLDESQLSNEDLDALEEGLDYVYGVIGQDVPLTDVEIKEALWYYYFDKDETVNWALEKVASIKVEQAKDAKKAKATTRKPHYRRPPSKLYMDSVSNTASSLSQLASSQGKSSLSSLASLRSTAGLKPALSSLTSRSTQPGSPSKPTGGSLLSLAQKSAGQRNMSALQSLASRQKSPSTPTSTTTSSPSLSSLSKLAGDKPPSTSLAHLASRAKTNSRQPTSLNSLSFTKNKSTSDVLGLAGRNTNSNSNIQTENVTKQVEQQKDVTPTANVPITSNMDTKAKQEQRQHIKKTNPLIAPPSPAATFLFQPRNQSPSSLSVDITTSLPSSLAQAFYEAMPSSSKLFKFDAPSPDDIVIKAQTQRTNKAKRTE